MTTCNECLKACPDHGMTCCATCHKHPGDCDMGDCETPATTRWANLGTGGQVMEVRPFCTKHATAPEFGWLRAGMKELV
jgi:hypothetical protein